MRQKLLLLLLLLTAWGARAQTPTWQSALSSAAVDVRDVAITTSGDVYVTGTYTGSVTFGANTISSNNPDGDVFVAKWAAGASTWAWGATLGGSTAGPSGDAVNQSGGIAVNGNRVYVIGQYHAATFTSGGNSLTNAGNNDMFVARFIDNTTSVTASGLLGSSGGAASEYAYGIAVNPTNGNVYVSGYFGSNTALSTTISGTTLTSSGSADVYVAKYFDNGTTFSAGGAVRAGGGSAEVATCLALNGNTIYIGGRFGSSATTVIGSSTLTSAGANDIFVARFTDGTPTATGGLAASNALRGGGDGTDGAQGIAVNGSSVYLMGYFNPSTVAVTLAGSTLANAGNTDIFVAKYTDNGSALVNGYAISDGTSGFDDNIQASFGGGIALVGNSVYVTSDFDTSGNIAGTNLTNAGGTDAFVAKYTDTGSTLADAGALRGGGAGNDSSFGIAVTGTQGVVGGSMVAPANFGTQLTSGSSYAARVSFAAPPTVTTATPGSITSTSAVLGGNVTADGGATVTERGVVYSTTNQTPTTSNTKAANGTGTGTFSATISGLAPSTTYYVRAYATNVAGTSYGAVVTFTTQAATTTVTSITTTTTSPTNASSITYTVTFAAGVTGLTASNFSLSPTVTGAGIGTVAVVSGSNNTQYTVTVNTGTGNGPLQLNLANDTGLTPGLSNDPFAGPSITIDKMAPTVTISSSAGGNGSTTPTTPIPFTVTFSESVNNFAQGDVTVSNGTISGFSGSGTTYTFNVTPTTPGTATTVNVAANVATDQAGNGNTAAMQFSLTYQPPLVASSQNVTVNLNANGTATLNASSVNNGSSGGSGTLSYTIQKIVYGRVTENSTLTLSTPNGVNFTAIPFASYGTPTNDANGNYRLGDCNAANSGQTAQNSYVGRSTGSMTATNGSNPNNNPTLGDPCAGTPKALAVQAAYSANAASLTYDCTEAGKTQYVLLTVTDGSGNSDTRVAQVTVNPPPTATISSVSPSAAQRGATVTVTGTNLSGVNSLTVNGAAATVSNLSATGFTFVVPSGATTGAGNLTVTAPCSQTLTPAFTVQATTVSSVTRLTPSPTATASVSYQVVFSGSVSGLTTSNFSLTTTGSLSGASVATLLGSGTTYTVVVNTGTGDGTLTLNVANSTGVTPTLGNVPYTSGEQYTIIKSFAAAPTLRIQAAGSASGNGDVTAFVDVVQVLQSGTSTAVANALQNGSFETNNVDPSSFKKTSDGVTADFWAFTGLSGISRNGSAFGSTAADGTSVALIQSAGDNNASISQPLAVPTGSYQVNFQAMQRNYTSKDQRLNVFLVQGGNTVFIGTIQPNNNTPPTYDTFTSATFSVAAPALTATVSTTSASPTSTAPIPFSVSFSQSVGTSFTASDVTVTGGTVNSSSFSGNANNDTFSFNVTPSGTGTVTVSLAANVARDANNTGNSASNSVSVQFVAPTISVGPVTLPNGTQGTAYSQTLTASGGTAPYTFAITAGALPAGLTIASNGTLAGTPTAGGSFTFTVTATDASTNPGPFSGSRSYTLTIGAPTITIAPATLPNGTVAVAYNQTLTASGGTAPYSFAITAGALPAGLTLSSAGVLSGTPTGGTSTFTVTATDASTGSGPYSGARGYTLTINAPTIAVSPATLPGGTVATAYSQTLTASGGTAPYTYTITAGALPAGLTIASNGTLAGTPTAGGSFTFTVTATDASTSPGPYSGSRGYTLTIAAPSIVISPAALPTGTQGTAYSQTLTTSGGTAPYRYSITAGALPAGLSLNLSNGTISGTPTVNGSFTFTVTATDASTGSGPYSGSRSYTLTIAAPAVTSVTWTGNTSTDWFTASNWSPTQVPSATIDVVIPTSPSGGRFPAITTSTANAQARNLTLNSGSTLTQTDGTLTLAANLTNNGTFRPTGGTVTLGNSTLSNILGAGNVRFWNLTVGSNGAQQSTSASTSVQRLLTLNGNFAINGNPFTLESNANGTAMVVNNGSSVLTGNVTVQRYIDPSLNPNLGYRHFSSPISNATVGSLATTGFTPVVNDAYNSSAQPGTVKPFPTVYGYDQSRLATATNNLPTFDKGWFSPSALSSALNVGQGYTVNVAADRTFGLTGPQNNGNIALNLARNTGATAADAGLALVGNPYPSPLDWSQVATTDRPGLDGVIYVFASNDPTNPYAGSYGSYNNGIGNISPVLPLGQGFFVRVSNDQSSATLTFKNSHRPTTYSNNAYRRTAAETRPLVQLTLKGAGSTVSDDAFVYFEQGSTEGYDAQYDAVKLPNPNGLNLSASLASKQLSINGLPELGSVQRVVPLAVGVPTAGSYSLASAQLLNLDATPVYLRDLQLGTLTDLRLQPSYQFTVTDASALITGRFELVFSPQKALATVPAALAQQVGLYPNPAKTAAFVELPASLGRQAVTATLVDALGRVARTVVLPAQGALAHQLDLHELPTGIYALRLSTSAGVVVKRLTVE